MRYVIIRDDDTNALTPVDCLERLYRPFLRNNLPVNLATIPNVATDTTTPDGRLEGFLTFRNGTSEPTVPIGRARELVQYLHSNQGFKIIQHGFHHRWLEFDRAADHEIPSLLAEGTRLLVEAGFAPPRTFVAPYDKLSRASLRQVARRFQVLSTGWFELRRLPPEWWPLYLLKKARQSPHWSVGPTVLLSHPGCLLSCNRSYSSMLENVVQHLSESRLTVLVTHWWEYFREGKPDEEFIGFLHQTADYLAGHPDIRVVTFSDVVSSRLPLN